MRDSIDEAGRFARWGAWVARHPWPVVIAWAVAIVLGTLGSGAFDRVAQNGASGIAGSGSAAVDEALRRDFDNPFLEPLVVTAWTPQHTLAEPAVAAWHRQAAAALRAVTDVAAVADAAEGGDPQLRSADGHLGLSLVGLAHNDVPAQQRAVPRVRAAAAALRAGLERIDPQAVLAVTGGPAIDYDINTSSAAGGDRAEKRALPLTLGILVIAFGTLVAAALPFLMGLATTMVSLGLAFLLAQLMPVSNLLGNVVTMIGLAVGIDYSLLMVKDYRARLASAAGVPATVPAVAAAVAEAGTTILWSGCTVAIGLLGLLWSPILETRSVGIGGSLVVLVSVLAALTLLPAILALLGPWIERLPIRLLAPRTDGAARWERFAARVVARPAATLVLATLAVLALAAPLLGARSGFSNEPWFLPRALESRVGADLLAAGRPDDATLTTRLLLRSTDGLPVAAPEHRAALDAYLERLRADARVGAVVSALGVQDAPRAPLYLSRDGRAALLEVVPKQGTSAAEAGRLARDLAERAPQGPFTLTVGGTPGYYNDYADAMWRSFPRVYGFVILSTLALLFAAFRSYLLPLKAVLANLLAIAAGLGVVTAIFQFGWLHGLVGLERPFASIPLEVPLMIFCLSFGLSMDYELFLLFRIQRDYAASGDNERATVRGLAAVGPVITGAGLIMTAVFGAFASADLPALKMIGVGLFTAVLVDATIIRALVVPAFMCIAGRWNWVPGRRLRR